MILAAVAVLITSLFAFEASAENRALIIGIDDYSDAKLKFAKPGAAAHDIKAIHGLLTTKLGYASPQVRVLIDQAATRQAILGSIADWLVAGSKPGEQVYIYFAGHGYFHPDQNGDEKDKLDEAIVPYDASVVPGGATPVINGLITDDDLSAALAALEGRHVTIVLDTSHSGRVTRSTGGGAGAGFIARAPQITGATRRIVIEPKVKAQKAEGGYIEYTPKRGSVTVWSAVSPSQVALIDASGTVPHGVFTSFYVEGLGQGKADQNGNGTVSNAELLAYLNLRSKAYCRAHTAQCEMGLTPRLDPAGAHVLPAIATKVTTVASGPAGTPVTSGAPPPSGVPVTSGSPVTIGQPIPTGVPVPGGPPVSIVSPLEGGVTIDKLTDVLGKGNVDHVGLEQFPPSPVRVGAKDIRFLVTSPRGGYLVLLNLTDSGDLYQLYPNQHSARHEGTRAGELLPGSTLRVPG